MNSIPVSRWELRLSQPFETHQAPDLRDLFGQTFEDEVQTQTYGEDGRPLYEYPRIQLKVMDSTVILLGIAEGAGILQRLWREVDPNRLGGERFGVLNSDFETVDEEISASAEPIEYRFVTPWLGLNQKNFRAYVGSRSQKFRRDELSRILVGNCLGLAKSLDMRLSRRIDADGRKLTSIKTTSNGQGVIGFIGKFQVNLVLPEYLGLGRSAARGFGAIVKAGG
jgi:hypothetical protein